MEVDPERLSLLHTVSVLVVARKKLSLPVVLPIEDGDVTNEELLRLTDERGWLFHFDEFIEHQGQAFVGEGYLRILANLSPRQIKEFLRRKEQHEHGDDDEAGGLCPV